MDNQPKKEGVINCKKEKKMQGKGMNVKSHRKSKNTIQIEVFIRNKLFLNLL